MNVPFLHVRVSSITLNVVDYWQKFEMETGKGHNTIFELSNKLPGNYIKQSEDNLIIFS